MRTLDYRVSLMCGEENFIVGVIVGGPGDDSRRMMMVIQAAAFQIVGGYGVA